MAAGAEMNNTLDEDRDIVKKTFATEKMHNCRTAASVTFSLYLPCWLHMYFHVCYYLLIKGSCLALLQSVQFSTKLALHTHAGAGKSPLPEQLYMNPTKHLN
jgi:hypothetical protein